MKTGKRILSVLLAMLMLAATMSVAFAAEGKKDPVYVIYKLPAFDSWDLDTLDVYYRDNHSAEIYSITKDTVFSDFDSDDQTGLLVRYDEGNYQAFFKQKSDIVTFHQCLEWAQKTDPEQKAWHFASGKINYNFFYVLADYNSPFIIYVEDDNGFCCHEFEINGLQYSSCRTETAGSYYCQKCRQSFSITFPAEHVYGEDILRNASTCTEGYVISRYCARCDSVETENGKPLNHSYPWSNVSNSAYGNMHTVPPTCFTKGYDEETCQICGKIRMSNIKDATGEHVYTNDGHCKYCGKLKDQPTTTPTQPTPAKPAVNPNACKYCGKVHTGTFAGLVKFFHNIMYFLVGRKK